MSAIVIAIVVSSMVMIVRPAPAERYSVNAVKLCLMTSAHDIVQSSLEERFAMIMTVIIRELDTGSDLNGLTAEHRARVESLAEQAIINWAVASRNAPLQLKPLTNLQHLLSEYCALADHL